MLQASSCVEAESDTTSHHTYKSSNGSDRRCFKCSARDEQAHNSGAEGDQSRSNADLDGSISLTAPLLSRCGQQRGLRVVDHGAVDDIGEASLEAPHGFFVGLAGGSFALVVIPDRGRVLVL